MTTTLKSPTATSLPDLLGGLAVIAVAVYFLAPSAWEPGAESLKNWVSARIFRETGGFPVLHHGPLYNLYLQFFLSFPYPLSIQLEHAVTHLATYVALLLLLRRFLPRWPSLMLLCAWIPALWVVEGGARVAGMGCLALYLAKPCNSPWSRGWVPVPLFCAALFDSFFIPFFGGHVVGTAILRLWTKKLLWARPSWPGPGEGAPWLAKAALIALIGVTALFQSPRPDNNINAFDYPWSPVRDKNILPFASIMVGNWKYVRSQYPESQWMYKDWYLTNDEAFGGAKTLWAAVRNNPELYLRNVFSEAKSVLALPPRFLIGFRSLAPPELRWSLLAILWLPLTFCGYWTLRWFRGRDELAKAFSLGAGMAGAAVAYSLVYVNQRYMMAFLPLGLLAAVHVGLGLRSLGVLARGGSLEDVPYPEAPSALTLGAVYAIAFLVFTAAQPYPWAQGGDFLQRNPYELRGQLWRARGQLLESLGRGKRVLASEEAWIRTFADVDIEKIYHPLYLPPFIDASGDTERFLESLDVIWASDVLTRPVASVGTQVYLRYNLHLEPFLRRAVERGWTREDVSGFGQIYQRAADSKHR